jgi:hypothetical protein
MGRGGHARRQNRPHHHTRRTHGGGGGGDDDDGVVKARMTAAAAGGVRESFAKCVRERLEERDLCSSPDEYEAVSEATVAYSSPSPSTDAPSKEERAPFPSDDDLAVAMDFLVEFFGGSFFTTEDAEFLVRDAAFDAWGGGGVNHHPRDMIDASLDDGHGDGEEGGGDDDVGLVEDVKDNGRSCYDFINYDNDDDDDGDYIGEGECELCERTIKLTRHHLVPKSTWPRMRKRLWNVAPLIESLHHQKLDTQGREWSLEKLEKILGTVDLGSLPATITNDNVRSYLARVCLLCRQCHSAVHRLHTEWELALEYNTMEKLLGCEGVMKFARWASGQHSGRSAR